MIAHRMQTIKTAQNLIYIENKSSALPASKGTSEYNEIIDRLQDLMYAHQKDNEDP